MVEAMEIVGSDMGWKRITIGVKERSFDEVLRVVVKDVFVMMMCCRKS